MEELIQQYQKLYREAGTGGEETNDQLAYKMIILTMQNTGRVQVARHLITETWTNCPDQDRRAIYEAFIEQVRAQVSTTTIHTKEGNTHHETI